MKRGGLARHKTRFNPPFFLQILMTFEQLYTTVVFFLSNSEVINNSLLHLPQSKKTRQTGLHHENDRIVQILSLPSYLEQKVYLNRLNVHQYIFIDY